MYGCVFVSPYCRLVDFRSLTIPAACTIMEVFAVLFSVGAKALTWLCVILVIAFLGYCFYIKYIHMKYDHIPGPPRDSFFLGHSPTFVRIMKKDGIVHNKFLEWAEIYGPVYRINILHYIILVVTCPEATKEILMSPKYPKDRFLYKGLFNLFGQRFLGNGLVTARDHELWYKQRRIMDPAFSSLYLRGLMGTFNERAEKLMEKLSEIADNNTEANMLQLVNCVTLDVIAKVAFGADLDLLSNNSPIPKAIEFNPKNWPFINEVREACRLLRTTGAQWIHERKTSMQNGEDVPKDILTQIIKTAATEKNMTEEDEEFMLDNFVTFFIAGQETTANQLAFCIMELARHPEILDKVMKEVDDVIGMKQEISYDDLGKLIYLSQVLKETLRIYPTAPGTSRDIPGDMTIDGIHLPGGFICLFNSYATGRMEKFFKEPLKFDPDRFHPDSPKPYYCYFPFALGPRSCLGQNFAQMEAKVVMAKLLQRFDFSLVPGQTFDIQDTGTLRPKSGVICTIKHRKYKN
ncbi:cholesterol 24-hydroxylase-like isoform X2 [Girardinichthys multiradiatus]|uniref:cholesterol 24-hydroxylase-like isoform X2 n=1 Tax=Girardinichthys multiradiatus TaxID=208333 RepID=UPI001FAB4AC1|nr:cholesterol 24-hydroxylase-like isoform X2 [Girardinichthys multiradiatus]